ncbi:MAG: GNAT family N-acetyltransferase [Flavobacteriaceae bacterium]|nr:GNAT family N-acetyltransferase [Flavobacteriaceae bacterium]
MGEISIREIVLEDNQMVKKVVQKVLMDLGAPKIGTAYSDKTLDCMYESYQKEGRVYYVVVLDGVVVGGAGIGPLDTENPSICELQKMYFLEQARGKGVGSRLLRLCLQAAKNMGYTQCYLETMPYMEAAQAVYKKYGFYYLDAPMGCTGHNACPVWMMKDL